VRSAGGNPFSAVHPRLVAADPLTPSVIRAAPAVVFPLVGERGSVGDWEPSDIVEGPLESETGTGEGGAFFERLRKNVRAALTDATRNNPLLYYASRTTRFDVPGLDSPFIEKLLTKTHVRRVDFCTAPLQENGASSDSAGDALLKKLRGIRARAIEFEEERGLRTLFVAIGMVSWPATDGGRAPLAPVALVPVRIVEDPKARGELVVVRTEGEEVVLNRALLTVAPPALAERIEEPVDDSVADDPRPLVRLLRSELAGYPGVQVHDRCALGIFNFAYMAMIDDLDRAQAAMEAHPVVRALAGDLEAQIALTQAREGGLVDVQELDQIRPVDELFADGCSALKPSARASLPRERYFRAKSGWAWSSSSARRLSVRVTAVATAISMCVPAASPARCSAPRPITTKFSSLSSTITMVRMISCISE
jgi:hypothetical protein